MATLAAVEATLDRMALSMAESRKEWEENREKSRKEAEERRKEAEERLCRLEKLVDRVTRNVGGLNKDMGLITELIIIPGVMEKMNALGHNFTIVSPERDFHKKDGKKLTEVDLMLENSHDVMVVEVKTKVNSEKVEHHLTRLKLLRKNESITGMTGKTMYAAIAGIEFTDGGRSLAVANGMYLIEIEEDNDRINVIPPSGKVGTW